ncbi:MAG: hypothetical protein QW548_00950 [Candidatus Aenigmatarchaeota archaeon]
MKYENRMEEESSSRKPTKISAYGSIGNGREYSLEIERVPKEHKEVGKAVPFIRLFCKSDGKCGV